jgi:hypothetical protein
MRPAAAEPVPSGARAADVLARQDRIPVWALPRSYLVIIGAGYFFTFYDIADIGYGMPAIAQQFHLSSSEGTFVALSIGRPNADGSPTSPSSSASSARR